MVPPTPTGVLKGTTWHVDWGDGSVWDYTSTADGDIPAAQMHTFTSVTECAYVGRWVVKNPCNQFLDGSTVFVVHGRDIPSDGDGRLRMEETTTHSADIVYVCEGMEHDLTLADISTWNCQNPNVPLPLNPADYDNDQPRTIQFIYGETPAGGVMNTITGNVLVGGTHITNGADGYAGTVITGILPPNPKTNTESITIPASCKVGERYYVYIKNWNKCNPYGGNPAIGHEYKEFIIEVKDAPNAPTVSTPQTYCYNTYPATVTAAPNTAGNTIKWYADAAKTGLPLFTGLSYTHGKTLPGVYHFYPAESSLLNGCEGPAADISFTIREQLAQPGVITGTTPVCINATGITYSLAADPPSMPVGGATEYYWTVPAGWTITGGQGSKQITVNVGGSSGAQTVSVVNRYTTAPNCPSLSRTLSVTVNPLSTGGSVTGGTTPLCSGTGTGTMTLSGHTGSVVKWQKRLNAGAWSDILNTATTYSETPASSGTWEYRAEVKSGACSSAFSGARTIIVDPASAGGSITGGTTPICLGSGTGVMTLSGHTGSIQKWQKRKDGGAWTDIVNTATTYSETPASSGTWDYRAEIKSGSCPVQYSGLMTIVVDPTSVGGSVSGGTTPLCLGSGTGTMTLSGHTGSVVKWQKRLNAGEWSDIVNTATTYSGTPASSGTWEYRAEVKSGTCASAFSAARTIIVDPGSVGGSITGGATPICLGSGTGVLTLSVHTGSIQKWQKRKDGGAWADIVNTTTTYSETPASSGTWDYRVELKSGSCPVQYSGLMTIVVDPTSVGGSVTGGTTPLCLGTGTGTMTLSGHTGSVVKWQKRLNAGAWSDIVNNTTTYSETPASSGTWEYRAEVKSGTCSSAFSSARTIIVDAASIGGNVTGGSTPVCYGINTGVMTVSGHTGTVQRWQKRVDGGTWSDIANTATTYSEIPSPSGTWEFRAIVKNGSCAEIPSSSRTIIVRPEFQLAQLHDDVSICNNTAANFNIVLTGGTSPYTVNYTKNATPLTAGPGYVSGTNISTGILTTGSYVYTITSAIDANGCSVTSAGTQITVTAGASLTGATLTGSGDACYGSASTLKSVVTGGAPPYSLNITGFGVVNPYNSGTNIGLTPPSLTVGAHNYTLASVTDGCGNTITPAAAYTINIFGIPDISGTNPATQTICNNSTATINLASTVNNTRFTYTVSTVPAAGFTWTAGKNPIAGSITDADGNGVEILSRQLQHDYTSPVTVTYSITPAGPGATACPGTLITREVVVQPTAVITSLATKTLCDNTPLGYTATSSTAGATFAWTRAVVAGISNGAGSGATALIDESLDNTTIAPVVVRYVITPTIGTCAGTPFNLDVTVQPTAVITSAATKTICDNASTSYVATSSTAGATFAWTRAVVAGIANAAGSGATATISENLDNTTASPVTVRYIITPTIGTCPGTPFNLDVTVQPTAVITSPATKTVCDNTPLGYTATSSTAGATFAWTRAVVAGISNGAGSGATALIDESLDNTTIAPVVVRYVITPTIGTCAGTPFNLDVTISPAPSVNNLSANVCDGSAFNIKPVNGVDGIIPPATTYAWGMPIVTGGMTGGASGSGAASISGTLVNPTATAQTATYTVTPSIGSCTGLPFVVIVTVSPLPATTPITGDADLCNNDVNKVYQVTGHVGSSYAWTVPSAITDDVFVGNLNFIILNAEIGSSGLGTIQVTEKIDATGCTTTKTLDIVVSPALVGRPVIGSSLLCVGDAGVSYSVTTPEPTSDYVWTLPPGASITSGDPNAPSITVTFGMAVTSGEISAVETSFAGCQVVQGPLGIDVKALPSVFNVSAPSFYCYGTGGVNVTLGNSQAGVNYQLYKNAAAEGAPVAGSGASLIWPAMTAGTYTVKATSAAAPFCNVWMNGSPVVEENPEMTITGVSVTNPLCNGANNGTIVINATGGFPPVATLAYSINGGTTYQSSKTFTNVGPGTYNIIVKDVRGCTVTNPPVTVSDPAALTISSLVVSSPIKCFADVNGKAKLTAAGGTGAYSYTWYYDAGHTMPVPGMTTDEASGLSAGPVYVKVTDVNNCSVSGSITVTEPVEVTASA
ncbi:MAG TPA: PKD-like domain-containing protein, partial [Bacteroidales bacterium]|nr:PKD-like domain-containing protein [Bacteroidales bacterium]